MKQWLAIFLVAALPMAAWASTDEAWQAFRATVAQSCRALVTVAYSNGQNRMICVHHKATVKAELTAPFADAAVAD